MTGQPLRAQDKLTLLLSLVPYLMEHDGVSVAEAAAHFEVSPTQLRDAVRTIAVSGVPGETHQYQIGDLFDIDWDELLDNDRIVLTHLVALEDSPRFSGREAAALIAGLQYLSALPENADRAVVASLTAKLTRGAMGPPTALAVARHQPDELLSVLADAVRARRRVEFDYRNGRGEREARSVDPLRAESIDRDWYLRGWDHGRGALRTFRLDRMTALRVTGQAISYAPGDVPLPDGLFQGSPEDISVEVAVANSALPLLADYIPAAATRTSSSDRPGWTLTTLRFAHSQALKRLISGHPGMVTVLSPPEARAEVAAWASAGAERYFAAETPEST